MSDKDDLIRKIKFLEKELRDCRTIFKTTFENTGNATILIGEDTKIIFSNSDFIKLSGYTSEEIDGKMSWADFVIPNDLERMMGYHKMRREKHGSAPRNYEFGFIDRSGSVKNIYMTIDMVPSTQMSIGSYMDVTEKKNLEGELLRIIEQERQDIGNDLHDGLAPHLVGVQFMVKVLKQAVESKNEINIDDVDEINEQLAQAIKHIRKLSKGFRPVDILSDGLIFAIEELVTSTKEIFGVKCGFEHDEALSLSENIVATHLYYIVKEAVNNALKHGKCGSILISIKSEDEGIVLKIEDDGIGLKNSSSADSGMGLKIMKYRANIVGAELDISGNKSGGTSVICKLENKTG